MCAVSLGGNLHIHEILLSFAVRIQWNIDLQYVSVVFLDLQPLSISKIFSFCRSFEQYQVVNKIFTSKCHKLNPSFDVFAY